VLRLARAKEREANARRDRAHKIARRIVTRAGVVALEKLNLRGMTRALKARSRGLGAMFGRKRG
jgi:IS605 OrfB family transposase